MVAEIEIILNDFIADVLQNFSVLGLVYNEIQARMLKRNASELPNAVNGLAVNSSHSFALGNTAQVGLLIHYQHPYQQLPVVLHLLLRGVTYLVRKQLFTQHRNLSSLAVDLHKRGLTTRVTSHHLHHRTLT